MVTLDVKILKWTGKVAMMTNSFKARRKTNTILALIRLECSEERQRNKLIV